MAGSPEVELHERDGYLEAVFLGSFSPDSFNRLLTTAFQACQDVGTGKLLGNTTRILDFENASTTDRYEIGVHGAKEAGGKIVVAMLGLPAQIDPEEFGARVARNRGLTVRLFTDRAAAISWLKGR